MFQIFYLGPGYFFYNMKVILPVDAITAAGDSRVPTPAHLNTWETNIARSRVCRKETREHFKKVTEKRGVEHLNLSNLFNSVLETSFFFFFKRPPIDLHSVGPVFSSILINI